MKKRGFTLIELLAVIVILAIIALIATPIVLNIIKESKDSAILRSADFYIDAVENAMGKEMLDGSKLESGIYTIMKDGNLCLELDGKTCKKGVIEVEVSGNVPNKGQIFISGSKLNDVDLVMDNKKIFKYNDEIVFNNGIIELSESIGTIVATMEIMEFPNHIEYDAILDGTTMPTIPGKITYKNGKEKDVTFYYIGSGSYTTHGSEITPVWKYFENGEVTQNADGTYTGTGNGVTFWGNIWDTDDIGWEYSEGRHLVGADFVNTYESVEIFDDIVSENYFFSYYLSTNQEVITENGKIVDINDKTPIQFFTDTSKVEKIILTYKDNSQRIFDLKRLSNLYVSDVFEDSIFIFPADDYINDFTEVIGISLYNDGDGYFIDPELKLSNITIEEAIDGKLEKKTFDVENYTEEEIDEFYAGQ